jgi:hypothetical protein
MLDVLRRGQQVTEVLAPIPAAGDQAQRVRKDTTSVVEPALSEVEARRKRHNRDAAPRQCRRERPARAS